MSEDDCYNEAAPAEDKALNRAEGAGRRGNSPDKIMTTGRRWPSADAAYAESKYEEYDLLALARSGGRSMMSDNGWSR